MPAENLQKISSQWILCPQASNGTAVSTRYIMYRWSSQVPVFVSTTGRLSQGSNSLDLASFWESTLGTSTSGHERLQGQIASSARVHYCTRGTTKSWESSTSSWGIWHLSLFARSIKRIASEKNFRIGCACYDVIAPLFHVPLEGLICNHVSQPSFMPMKESCNSSKDEYSCKDSFTQMR